jgi:hypothetical protein
MLTVLQSGGGTHSIILMPLLLPRPSAMLVQLLKQQAM